MNNISKLENIKLIVEKERVSFDELAKVHKAVNFQREASFALQILSNPRNSYLAGIAFNNPDSLKFAILNVAAIGLSLSPVHKLAYLLPRKNEVCLDISYRGLIQLAIDIHSIKWAQCFIVYEKDKFKLNGLGKEPTHETKAFDDNGKIKGVYITVKTYDGDFLTHTMKISEVHKIRDRSEAWKKDQSGPWKTDEEEMIKKTCARQASKWWPMTDTGRKRFDEALDVTNTAEQIDLNSVPELPANGVLEQLNTIREGLTFLERSEEKYISHLSTVYKREIKVLEDLTEVEINQALPMINQWIEAKKTKDLQSAKIEVEESVKTSQEDELDAKLGLKNENTKSN